EWRPRSAPLRLLAAVSRGIKAVFGGVFFALAWLVLRLARALRWLVGGVLSRVGAVVMKPYDMAAAPYARRLPGALRRPGLVLGVAVAAFAFTMLLVPRLGLDLIPQLAQDRFELTVKLPPGTQLRDTDALVRAIAAQHEGQDGIRALYGVSGAGTRLDASPTESG